MSRIKISVALVTMFSSILVPAANAAGLVVNTTSPVISSIPNVGNIWKGDIPTSISYPTDSYSEKLEFPITGALPISVLADRANGVDVDFAIWTDSGVKLGSQTIYSFSWNPVGPNTMVSMYLSRADNLYGTHTMLITTSYTTSTTGLLSRYLKDEQRVKISINKSVPLKAPDAPVIKGSLAGETAVIEFDSIEANPQVSKYQLTVSSLTSPQLSPTSALSFGPRTIIMEGLTPKFIVSKSEINSYFSSGYATQGSPYLLLRVEAVNAQGNSSLSNGIYFEPKNFGLSIFTITKKSNTSKTIACVKGQLTKKVTATNPKCPAGYKVKK
ncbi:hypothetical protein [Candidatus Planktophila versatilis]|uniref:hypothetical protein n=1 Tax=Candidatus Planktophila versatilis TaxID=1884905 RepID=UPI003CF2E26A